MDLNSATTEELRAELAKREVTLTLSRGQYDLLRSFFKEPLMKYAEENKGKGGDDLTGLMTRILQVEDAFRPRMTPEEAVQIFAGMGEPTR
jgi:hypothetical protein